MSGWKWGIELGSRTTSPVCGPLSSPLTLTLKTDSDKNSDTTWIGVDSFSKLTSIDDGSEFTIVWISGDSSKETMISLVFSSNVVEIS